MPTLTTSAVRSQRIFYSQLPLTFIIKKLTIYHNQKKRRGITMGWAKSSDRVVRMEVLVSYTVDGSNDSSRRTTMYPRTLADLINRLASEENVDMKNIRIISVESDQLLPP
ncbi:MAG: hypothetical protein ABH832_04430 [bacterium]